MCEESMKRISLVDLKKSYEEKQPRRIVYNTDNNRTQTKGGTLKEYEGTVKPACELSFDELIICLQPNAVGLKGPGGVISFRGIETVWLENYDAWDAVYLKCRGSDVIFGLLFDY